MVKEFVVVIKGGKLFLKVEGFNVWVRLLLLCFDEFCFDVKMFVVLEFFNWYDGS